MAIYHCPYCDHSITHRPELAGARVACESCGGSYYEPSDPLPGVKPIKADDQEAESVPMASLAVAPVLTPAGSSAQDQTTELRSAVVLQPYERAGQKAVVISWQAEGKRETKVGMTKNCGKEEGNDMILRIAAKLIKRKWPEIYPLIAKRLDQDKDSEI